MKKYLFTMVAVFAVALAANAQFQLGVQGSYLKGIGDNKSSLWGGGVHAKFLLGKTVAVGAIVRSYPTSTSNYTVGSTNYSVANLVTIVGGSLDFLLSKSDNAIQPYIGTDAGVSIANSIVKYSNSTNQGVQNKNNQTFFLLSPKLGVNIGLGQTFGIFGQAQYNLTFGNGNPQSVSIGGIPNPVTSTPVSKFFTLDAGIYIRLVGAGKGK